MTIPDSPRRRENAFTLARRMVSGGINLAKLEARHARAEMGRNLVHLRGGIVLLALAAGIAVMFVVALVAFVMAVLVVIGLWWVALLLLIVMLVAAGLLGWRGVKRVTSTSYTPEETIASVKEEMAWAKARLLRRS